MVAAGVLLLACMIGGPARAAPWAPVVLSDSLGSEIDATEREIYHLFPDVLGFERARFSSDGSAFRVEYSYRDNTRSHTRTAGVSPQSWEATRAHAGLVERYRARAATPPGPDPAESQFRLALRLASRSSYDVSRAVLEDLVAQYPQSPVAPEAATTLSTIQQSVISRRGLFLPGAIYDLSGRTDLMVFAGYYGIWTGIAIPVAFNSDRAEAYALGLLLAPAASLLIANKATKAAEIGIGRAHMISLGGNLGTWQGLGWAAVADADGNDVVATGLVCGLAGIAGAAALTRGARITEGHGAFSDASFLWGGWFGFVAGAVADVEDDDLLQAALIGSDVLVLGTTIAARGSPMSRGRVRLISLTGLVGTAFGFGIDLLCSIDSGPAAIGVAGAGTIAGLALGTNLTKNHDRDKTLSGAMGRPDDPSFTLAPELRPERDAAGSVRLVPVLALRARF